MCEIGYCCTLMKTTTAAHIWFDMINSLFFVFPLEIWCKINKLLKHYEYQLTKRCLEGRLEGFELSWWFSFALVRRYNTTLSKVIDCHAPLKTKTVKVRPAVPWYNDDIKAAKRLRRKAERTWRRTRCVWLEYFQVLQKPRDVPHEPGQAGILH